VVLGLELRRHVLADLVHRAMELALLDVVPVPVPLDAPLAPGRGAFAPAAAASRAAGRARVVRPRPLDPAPARGDVFLGGPPPGAAARAGAWRVRAGRRRLPSRGAGARCTAARA